MRLPPLLPLRAAWLLLPVVAGPAVADALADRSRTIQVVASALAWLAWGGTLAATLVPRTVTLTAVRILVPGALALVAWSTPGSDEPGWVAAGLTASLVALLAALAPATADAFVDGSSYGDEARVALRVPPAVGFVVVPLAWAGLAVGAVSGPLLLAAEQWLLGAVACLAGIPVVGLVAVRLHVLSRRWLVFVPAGLVVHDPLALSDPILFQRHLLRRVGPAPLDGDGLDVTGGALGLALEVRAAEPVSVGVRRGRDTAETTGVAALVVTPGRPGTTLELARARRLPVD